jgi:hypothetical protein
MVVVMVLFGACAGAGGADLFLSSPMGVYLCGEVWVPDGCCALLVLLEMRNRRIDDLAPCFHELRRARGTRMSEMEACSLRPDRHQQSLDKTCASQVVLVAALHLSLLFVVVIECGLLARRGARIPSKAKPADELCSR